jgi:transposase
MLIKTILNRIEKHPGFIYEEANWHEAGTTQEIEVRVRARRGTKPICSGCHRPGALYDTRKPRAFQYVPLWGIAVFFVYSMRRVRCGRCGVRVEVVPWASGKRRTTASFEWFLASWAKRLSWAEVAEVFGTSWETVFRAVERAVEWGRAHAEYGDVTAIGVDEIQWRKGHEYLTLVYQIDGAVRRLLWVGKDRKKETLERFFDWWGKDATVRLRFVCSDMWKAYLKVITERAGHCLHVLDRYHIVAQLSKAIDKVRAEEARSLKRRGKGHLLKNCRWAILRRPENRTEEDRVKLAHIVLANLRTAKAMLLREELQVLWTYRSAYYAGRFLDGWCRMVMRSRIEPLKKFARTLRNHRPLILNWFKAKGLSAGVVEGLNAKAKLTMKKAYGFRTYRAIEVALYHTLGHLPRPSPTHRFC